MQRWLPLDRPSRDGSKGFVAAVRGSVRDGESWRKRERLPKLRKLISTVPLRTTKKVEKKISTSLVAYRVVPLYEFSGGTGYLGLLGGALRDPGGTNVEGDSFTTSGICKISLSGGLTPITRIQNYF